MGVHCQSFRRDAVRVAGSPVRASIHRNRRQNHRDLRFLERNKMPLNKCVHVSTVRRGKCSEYFLRRFQWKNACKLNSFDWVHKSRVNVQQSKPWKCDLIKAFQSNVVWYTSRTNVGQRQPLTMVSSIIAGPVVTHTFHGWSASIWRKSVAWPVFAVIWTASVKHKYFNKINFNALATYFTLWNGYLCLDPMLGQNCRWFTKQIWFQKNARKHLPIGPVISATTIVSSIRSIIVTGAPFTAEFVTALTIVFIIWFGHYL